MIIVTTQQKINDEYNKLSWHEVSHEIKMNCVENDELRALRIGMIPFV